MPGFPFLQAVQTPADHGKLLGKHHGGPYQAGCPGSPPATDELPACLPAWLLACLLMYRSWCTKRSGGCER